ncbi:hypothetical protein GDO78_003185 [Eleutherodactylus coqui]|uniref:Uncharacterized protein n=1 Tax=Eleutherodactylus coqui TaxID=57060 RepID=A0A8J6EWJ9_ELECQ|nr:hypothetical protein GDO78_003185 [Eleutherodactylus coqui]
MNIVFVNVPFSFYSQTLKADLYRPLPLNTCRNMYIVYIIFYFFFGSPERLTVRSTELFICCVFFFFSSRPSERKKISEALMYLV